MARFDEIELIREPEPNAPALPPVAEFPLRERASAPAEPVGATTGPRSASLLKRMLAFATDFSLFIAMALALSPLLPQAATLPETLADGWVPIGATLLFLILVSYYYFVGSWLIWGKTIGGTIFETRVTGESGSPLDVKTASRRWAWTIVSILTAGAGFLPALLPGHRSLPDRLSTTRTAAG